MTDSNSKKLAESVKLLTGAGVELVKAMEVYAASEDQERWASRELTDAKNSLNKAQKYFGEMVEAVEALAPRDTRHWNLRKSVSRGKRPIDTGKE